MAEGAALTGHASLLLDFPRYRSFFIGFSNSIRSLIPTSYLITLT